MMRTQGPALTVVKPVIDTYTQDSPAPDYDRGHALLLSLGLAGQFPG